MPVGAILILLKIDIEHEKQHKDSIEYTNNIRNNDKEKKHDQGDNGRYNATGCGCNC